MGYCRIKESTLALSVRGLVESKLQKTGVYGIIKVGPATVLQSFAEAFANALAVRPCRNRTEICLLAATKRAGGDEGPMAVWISWSDKFPIYRERNI